MESHPGEHYRQFFQECCISNALDGSKDGILWEDDGENKDDSDWVMDKDSVVSYDGESHE